LPGVQSAPSPVRSRQYDLSSWVEDDLSTLGEQQRKRYEKRKNAVIEYFTTDKSIDEITLRNHLSQETLQKLVEKCLKRHADGRLWGFRALLPGVAVIDHPLPLEESSSAPSLEASVAAGETRELWEETGVQDAQEEDDEQTATLVAIKVRRDSLPEEGSTASGAGEPERQNRHDGAQARESLLEADVASSTGDGEAAALPQEEPAASDQEQPTGVPQEPEPLEERATQAELPAAERSLEEQPTRTLENLSPAEGEPSIGAAQEEEDEAKICPDAEELLPTLIDERMLPAPLADEADTVLLPGVHPEQLDRLPTTILPLAGSSDLLRRLAFEKRATQQMRRIRARRHERSTTRRKRNRLRTYLSLGLLLALLVGLLPPVGAALAAYNAYNNVKSVAEDGVRHLLNIKDLLTLDKNDPLAALDGNKLQKAQSEFRSAGSDFLQLQQLIERNDVRAAIQEFAPDYMPKLDMAGHLVQVALDISRMGDEMSGIGLMAASIIHGSPLSSNSNKPLLTAQDVTAVQGSLIHALYYIDDISRQMNYVDLQQLPMINAKQRSEIASLLKELPAAQKEIVQAQQMIPLVSWLLGVDGQRRYLIQTMDNAELRPGGGFTGQYGVLVVQNGVVGPVALRDVAKLDYAGNGFQMGRQAPAGYSWMHMGNFGLRDSNVSGDYPTTARINIQVFQDEGGGPVDGDIAFTPTFIAHILDVTGPIQVKEYGETITSSNLADRLHYYQQDPAGIARQEQITGQGEHDARKAFTSLVAKLLLDKVRHLPASKLLAIVKGAVKDIQARDLELYFTNPAVENWLVQQGYSGGISSFKNIDGFHVVQSNISVSKASQYVHSIFEDDITLDAQGGATHNLTITLEYNQRGPVYGFDTYTDYIRVYAPADAQFLGGSGFDSGHPVCGPGSKTTTTTTSTNPPPGNNKTTPPGNKCDSYNYIPPDGSRYCPSGNYSLGVRYQNPPVDSVGPPTALQSDLPGRAMWGGLTETPKNCTSYITLSWYVPHAHINPKDPADIYSLLVGKQGGMVPTVIVKIDASALHLKGVSNLNYQQDIHADTIITLKGPQPKPQPKPAATATPTSVPTSTPTRAPGGGPSAIALPSLSWRLS
jgi:hypothetical protein